MNTYRAEMGRAVFNNLNFWKKFVRFLFLGISVFLLLFLIQTPNFQGDQQVLAAPQGCNLTAPDPYPQCGTGSGSCINSGPIDSKNTVLVTPQVSEDCTIVYGCQDLGVKPGECGNPVDQGPPPPQQCTESTRDYPQCGGTTGLEGRDPTHTYIVREFTDSCSGGKRYEVVEDKGNIGQCQQPPQQCTESTRDYPQCGGTVGLEGRDPTHTFIVREFTDSCTGGKRYDVVEDKGNLGQCQVSPTPPPSFVPTPPPGAVVCNDNEVALHVNPNPSNIGQNINFSISGDASTWIGDNFSGGVTGCSGPWNSINCTAASSGDFTWTHTWRHCVGNFNNCSNTCSKSINFNIRSPQPVVTPTPAPVVTPTPAPVVTPTPAPVITPAPSAPPQGGLNCPSGFHSEFRDNILICIQNTNTNNNNNQNQNNNTSSSSSSSSATNNITFGNIGAGVPVVTTPGGVVTTTSGQVLGVKELPKTGLPALAWSALAFIPAGFRLRRLGKVKKDLLDDPNFIWENRKFKAGS